MPLPACAGDSNLGQSLHHPPPAFFSAMEDLPVAPGLRELPDQALQFDKPEGRIVELVAEIEAGNEQSVSSFYSATLPQLGWTQKNALLFNREHENLALHFEQSGAQKFLRMTIAPAL